MGLALALAVLPAACADSITVRPALEKTDVFVGEGFVFQIQVQGSDQPAPPDLSTLKGFTVESLGGQQNNRQSISIVNGRMNQVVERGYTFSYRLTPQKAGRLQIPSLSVQVDGQTLKTQPVAIQVRKPQETDDFKFRVSLSRERCYVGEPIVLTATWYFNRNVRRVAFTVPATADSRFFVTDLKQAQDQSKECFSVPMNSEEAVAEKGTGRLGSRDYATLTFKKVLIPKEAGVYTFPEATAACEALVGQKRPRRRSLFDDFFGDDPFNRGVYQSFVSPSEPLALEVVELPADGRPANFSGLVGNYRVSATATPTEVNVGDPITLTVRVTGPAYLDHVELPPLGGQASLAERFRIPKEQAEGKVEGDTKVFTQTLRALDGSVTEIPPIELGFFDTKAGAYRVAKSKPIPLTVHATTVLTTEDVEGGEVTPVRTQLTAWREGIAHNYEDPSVLENQAHGPVFWLASPVWAGLTGVPPLAYAVLGTVLLIRRKGQANPALRRRRRAFAELNNAIAKLQARAAAGNTALYSDAIEALRAYLGAKLEMTGGALTFKDVEAPLKQRGVSEESLASLKELFEQCERYQYAGGHGLAGDAAALLERALAVAKALEKEVAK